MNTRQGTGLTCALLFCAHTQEHTILLNNLSARRNLIMNDELSLTIETSGLTGSVAIGVGDQLIDSKVMSAPLKHSTETLPLINKLFNDHNFLPEQLKTIYVSAGPGSFTGIRIAVTMAKTLAYALDAEIVAVPSLDVIALNAVKAVEDGIELSNIGVVLEAGRGNIFCACYSFNTKVWNENISDTSLTPFLNIELPPTMETPDYFLSKTPKPLHILGEGINYHINEFVKDDVIILNKKYYAPSAENAFECGKKRKSAGLIENPSDFTPIYMRKPEAELKWKEQKK